MGKLQNDKNGFGALAIAVALVAGGLIGVVALQVKNSSTNKGADIEKFVNEHQDVKIPKNSNVQDKRLPIGSTVDFDGVKITLSKVEKRTELNGKTPYNSGGTYFVTYFALENATDADFDVIEKIAVGSAQGTLPLSSATYGIPEVGYYDVITRKTALDTAYAFDASAEADSIILFNEKEHRTIKAAFKIE